MGSWQKDRPSPSPTSCCARLPRQIEGASERLREGMGQSCFQVLTSQLVSSFRACLSLLLLLLDLASVSDVLGGQLWTF